MVNSVLCSHGEGVVVASEQAWAFKVLVSVAWADGLVREEEQKELSQQAEDLLSGDDLQEVQQLISSPIPPSDLLDSLPDLTGQRQSFGFRLLARCAAVAHADGSLDAGESTLIYSVGRLFGFDADFVDLVMEFGRTHHGEV